MLGGALSLVHFQATFGIQASGDVVRATLWTVFFILSLIAGVAAWLFVLAQESRHVAEEESSRQTTLLMHEIEAHQAHRRHAAEGQGGRRSGEQGQEPLCRRPLPRTAHPAQRHPRLRPAAGARRRNPAAPGRRHQGRAPQRRAPVRPDRRAARRLQDRVGPLPAQSRRGPPAPNSSTSSSTCSACRPRPRASTSATCPRPASRSPSIPTKAGCARS